MSLKNSKMTKSTKEKRSTKEKSGVKKTLRRETLRKEVVSLKLL